MPMKHRLIIILFILLQSKLFAMGQRVDWDKAIDSAIRKYGLKEEKRIASWFRAAKMQLPPKELALLAFKSERKIELWGKNSKQGWTHIHDFPMTAFSGKLGPKLKEHDMQIPEGIYKLTSFNPFSSFHLSLMVNYPNAFDKKKAKYEGRKKLGNNIFIHGSNLSAGCLAIGNQAIDQLFYLVRKTGLKNTKLIIAPNDIRCHKAKTAKQGQPVWLPELYDQIKVALKPYQNCHG
jgi:murein L,D-transpeptidase YafK